MPAKSGFLLLLPLSLPVWADCLRILWGTGRLALKRYLNGSLNCTGCRSSRSTYSGLLSYLSVVCLHCHLWQPLLVGWPWWGIWGYCMTSCCHLILWSSQWRCTGFLATPLWLLVTSFCGRFGTEPGLHHLSASFRLDLAYCRTNSGLLLWSMVEFSSVVFPAPLLQLRRTSLMSNARVSFSVSSRLRAANLSLT